MKKILSTLLLLTFCTVQGTWAGDVIIIGSDGQARYEDESKNVPITQNDIQNVKKKDILNEVTITDDTGKRESIYIDYKGKIKKVEETQTVQTKEVSVDKTKETGHQRVVRNATKTLYNVDSILAQYGYGKKDNSSKSNKEYMKMNLLDGDYVIGFKDAPYIAEYHKDGSLMGLAKVDKKVLSDNKASVVFYEYRVGYNTTTGMGLKHILFLDYEKDKYISQYIYNVDGKLLCRQINNDIYVASEARNMIPDWSKKINVKVYNQTKNLNRQPKKIHNNVIIMETMEGIKTGVIATAAVVTAPIWIPLLWWVLSTGDWTH